MDFFRIKILFTVFFFITSCSGLTQTLKTYDGKMPPPDTSIYEKKNWMPGMLWNGRQYVDFGYSLNKDQKVLHYQATLNALNNLRDMEISEWSSGEYFGKIRVLTTFPESSGYCRIYQSLIGNEKIVRHQSNKACRMAWHDWVYLF